MEEKVTNVLAPALLPVGSGQALNPLRITFVAEAIRNPVLFHATLFRASAHDDLLRGNQKNLVTLLHQGETIRLINADLNSSPIYQISDSTIAAVTCLLAYEVGSPCFICGNVCLLTHTDWIG